MLIKGFLNQSFDYLLERVKSKQNTRCKINTGFICNQACSFCYFYSQRKVSNLSIRSIFKQLEIAKAFGIESVDFSGGEPTIHEEFMYALQRAQRLDFKNICCITNGSKLCDPNFFERCIDYGLNEVLLSIHGVGKVHDTIARSKNSFKKALTTIFNCHNNRVKIRINTVVTKENYQNLPMLAEILNIERPFQWNLIMYKMQYECGDPDRDDFVSHSRSSEKIKEAIDIASKVIKNINVRYIPFCYMKGYEQHVTNYPQKRYDPYEWCNWLLRHFELPEDEFMAIPMVPRDIDLTHENENNVTEIRTHQYTKSEGCVRCVNFLICDGFENKYAEREHVYEIINPTFGKMIKDPLHYRRGYYEV
jgi:MoaA/NifB/PqqE/SkfB family radical SAM enzyme